MGSGWGCRAVVPGLGHSWVHNCCLHRTRLPASRSQKSQVAALPVSAGSRAVVVQGLGSQYHGD